jgi:hypothetical protein
MSCNDCDTFGIEMLKNNISLTFVKILMLILLNKYD